MKTWNEKIDDLMMVLFAGLALAFFMTAGFSGCSGPDGGDDPTPTERVDDWQFTPGQGKGGWMRRSKKGPGGAVGQKMPPPASRAFADGEAMVGFSVGGAKDINNFRENIANGFLPLPTDLTCEGLYYDYYFNTGEAERSDELFYPSYSAAVTKDPFSGEVEYYLTVGLNSGITSFERKKLNLVVVLDISGSMGSAFDKYYYDRFGRKHTLGDDEGKQRKIDVAVESIMALLDQLTDEDRFGMVLYDNEGYLAKPLRLVAETDLDSIRSHIRELEPQGGTNMSAGMRLASEQYSDFLDADKDVYENRIIFLTDAMPNRGEFSEEGLFGMTGKNAAQGVHTTFVGIGVDFNTELVEGITKIRGANYYSVHSGKEFKQRMGDEFEFMVTPLVFNLALNLESGGFRIEKVYGSPEADEATGALMKVNTLFPSAREEEETRGGVVLLKLSKKPDATDDTIYLAVEYEDRDGSPHRSARTIHFADRGAEQFDNRGIRKAVLLARYTNLMKAWLIEARSEEADLVQAGIDHDGHLIETDGGIVVVPEVEPRLGRWERQSRPLFVDDHYRAIFLEFKVYFADEVEAISDSDLDREIELLARLI